MTTRDPMAYTFYRAATACAAPLLAVWLRTSRHRALLERFHPQTPQLDTRPIWLHACSVGEIGAAKPVLDALHERWPDIPIVLTTSTESGLNLAKPFAAPWLHITRLPFDTARAVRRFLDALDPRGLLLMETELWPSLIVETRRRDIPVMLISGRVSAKHYRRYQRAAWVFRPLLARLSAAAVQTPLYAERLTTLGVPSERIHVTGNAKYDGAILNVDGIEATRTALATTPDTPILVFGSTRPGDEALAAACGRQLLDRFPNLRLVIAPRHPQRLDDALRAIGEPVDLWSAASRGEACRHRILAVDTMGDLIRFYALATVAVVGGSFFPGVEGHNPFEPAALGIATVFGPYMANFAEPASMLLDAGGAVQVKDPGDLPAAVAELLDNPARRAEIGSNARNVVVLSRGAIARTLDLIQTHLVL